MAPFVDVNEWRAERTGSVVKDGSGREWPLPSYLPAHVSLLQMNLEAPEKGRTVQQLEAMVRELFVEVFGSEHVEDAMRAFSFGEVGRIIEVVYRTPAGESSTSDGSSPKGGKSSKRTSNASTGST